MIKAKLLCLLVNTLRFVGQVDWDLICKQDLQAQARAHRLGQRNEVRVFRLVTVLLFNKDYGIDSQVTTPQELNNFMARNEEEEEYFHQYDENLFGEENFLSFEEKCRVKKNLTLQNGSKVSKFQKGRNTNCQKVSKDSVDETNVPIIKRSVSPKQLGKQHQTANAYSDNVIGSSYMTRSSLKKELFQSNSITEETLLIQCKRLIDYDEVPATYRARWAKEEVKETEVGDQLRGMRKAKFKTLAKISAGYISDATFLRALHLLEKGEVSDLSTALLLEKNRREKRRRTENVEQIDIDRSRLLNDDSGAEHQVGAPLKEPPVNLTIEEYTATRIRPVKLSNSKRSVPNELRHSKISVVSEESSNSPAENVKTRQAELKAGKDALSSAECLSEQLTAKLSRILLLNK